MNTQAQLQAASAPRTTRRGWLFQTVTLAGASAALAACGGRDERPGARLSAPVSISYVAALPNTNPEGRAWYETLQDWNTQNDKIVLRLEDGQASMNMEKLKAMLSAGTVPDLRMSGYRGDPADLYRLGAIVDLDLELKTEKDWGKQRADIYPGFLETSTWAGKLVALPGHGTCQAMIYSPSLLQKAGVAPPQQRWTWNDFLASARRAMRPPDVWGLDLTWSWVFWAMWIGSNGARPLTKDNRRLTLTTPEVMEATTFMLDLIRSGVAPPESSPELFMKGQTVFEHQGSYRIPALRQNNAEFGAIHMPIKKELFVSASGYSAVVFKDVPAERRHAAALVARWINSAGPQAKICAHSLNQPVSKAGAEHKTLREALAADPQAKAFADISQYAWRWPNIPSFSNLAPVLQTAITEILGQKIGLRDGLARAEREGQPILDEDARLADTARR